MAEQTREQKRNQESRPEKRKKDQLESWQIGDGPVSAPVGTKTSHSKHRHRRNWWISMTAVLLSMISGLAAVVSCYGFPAPIQAQLDIRPEEHIKRGSLTSGGPGKSKPMEAGSFRVMSSQLPTIETGSQDCNIEYENLEESHYSSRTSLYLKETGKLTGDTTRVDPGYYVESVQLRESLPPGEYPTIVRIELLEDKTPAGEMSIDTILRMIENQGGETG